MYKWGITNLLSPSLRIADTSCFLIWITNSVVYHLQSQLSCFLLASSSQTFCNLTTPIWRGFHTSNWDFCECFYETSINFRRLSHHEQEKHPQEWVFLCLASGNTRSSNLKCLFISFSQIYHFPFPRRCWDTWGLHAGGPVCAGWDFRLHCGGDACRTRLIHRNTT